MTRPPTSIDPIFTLRGHPNGVSSLAYYKRGADERPYLISGDDEGTLIGWDLTTFKLLRKYLCIFQSTIQSIKPINLTVGGDKQASVVVVQSRDDGVRVLNLTESTTGNLRPRPAVLASYPTHESLFSRGDAKSLKDGQAILAYPSLLESNLVTVRLIGEDATTKLSGSAGNSKQSEKSFPVFDIIIMDGETETGGHRLFVAYEDGSIGMYEFHLDVTETVPVLNTKGLDVRLIKRIDFGFGDFVAAYDVVKPAEPTANCLLVAGSPGKDLCFAAVPDEADREPSEIHRVELRRSGVSAIAARPDVGLVVVASWDKSVYFYSLQERKLLASLDKHSKQVQSILVVPRPSSTCFMEPTDPDINRTKHDILVCCASQDGTISVSSPTFLLPT